MEEEYWNRFLKSGQIKDYLYYKGLCICRKVMEGCEAGRDKNCESDYSEWNGTAGSTYWRI